ncbi:PilN domain-containing protein [Marilutibacter spongiae]|uniref:PilN domain-containing protein n=1 Tax=Marilutibacter spongiae TaxID=2025720 RepID=A0A7W3Y5P4_9GAMM|nr:PilN domain-containing protein [Lysobacter spongiae]MBB1060195.1 PilN domain-containing protein [Lysobacter spongiae]
MARINLLPWRAERRKQRQKEFGVMAALSALAAVIVSFLIVSYYNGQISGQNTRNDYLRAQIVEVDKQIAEIEELDRKKGKLLARKEVIEELQANRSQMVHLFDSLVRTIPDGVVLTAIKQDAQTLTLTGRSQSNSRVSTYMRNLEGSGWMTKPDLSIIEAKGSDKGLPYEFSLQVQLANPNAPVDEDGDGIPDQPAAMTGDAAVEGGEGEEAPSLLAPVDAQGAAPAADGADAAAPAEGSDAYPAPAPGGNGAPAADADTTDAAGTEAAAPATGAAS